MKKTKIEKQAESYKKKSATKKALKAKDAEKRGALMPRPTVFKNKKRYISLDSRRAIKEQLD